MTAPRAQLTVIVSRPGLVALGTDPAGPIYKWWVRLLARIDANAKRKLSNDMVHVRTGNLRSSQEMPFVSVTGAQIVGVAQNRARYAAAVHNGVGERDIVARHQAPGGKPGMLRFAGVDGAPVFRAAVHIPPQAGRPWLRDAMIEELHRAT